MCIRDRLHCTFEWDRSALDLDFGKHTRKIKNDTQSRMDGIIGIYKFFFLSFVSFSILDLYIWISAASQLIFLNDSSLSESYKRFLVVIIISDKSRDTLLQKCLLI